MKTTTKRLSLLRTVEVERELVRTLALAEHELRRAGVELDRFYADVETVLLRETKR